MRIRYFGHAAVGLTGSSGLRVLLDPYLPGAFDGRIGYSAIPDQWDVVIISHDHLDHNYLAPEFGTPVVITQSAAIDGLQVERFQASHGTNHGTMTATTAVSRFVIDGLTVVHPGDIGIPVTQDLIASLQGTDLLFVPVGGRFTLDPSEALDFVAKLNPRIAIPIHFKTPAVLLPLRPVEDFLELCGRVRRFNAGEVRLDPETLPLSTEIWHLPPLL